MNSIKNYMGNKFFWKMVWPIIVGAISNNNWQTIGAPPSTDQDDLKLPYLQNKVMMAHTVFLL